MKLPSGSFLPLVSVASFVAGLAIGSVLKHRRKKSDAASNAETHLYKIVEHSFTGVLITVGLRLDLYRHLSSGVSSVELAKTTGYSERWLREWLAQSAAAGFLSYVDGKFTIKPEYGTALAGSMGGTMLLAHALVRRAEATQRAIETGRGADYDTEAEDLVEAIDMMNNDFFSNHLVEDIIEKVVLSTGETLVQMLERGVNVADVGCGCGMSTVSMARRFPKSHFFAYELSPKCLAVLTERAKGLDNVTVRNVAVQPLGASSERYSFVYCHDLLHDMTKPRSLIAEVKRQLADGGCWVVVDVKCGESLAQNIAIPGAALDFGYSCLLCLLSATSEEGGEGLGTRGLHTKLMRQWATDAGFHGLREMGIKSKPECSCFVIE